MDSLGTQLSFGAIYSNPLLFTSPQSLKLVLRDTLEPLEVIKTLPYEVLLEVCDRGGDLLMC